MRIPQDAMSEDSSEVAGECRKHLVVRVPISPQPFGDLGGRGIRAIPVQSFAVEGFGGTDRGFALARIERGAIGGPVQVDDISRMGCTDDRGAQAAKKIIELRYEPVGVGQIEHFGAKARL